MGDLANAYACDTLIDAFASDIIQKYRSRFLDKTFGDKVRYYVMADDNWRVRLYAAIDVGNHKEEHFRVEGSPDFYGPSDSIVDEVATAFPDLSEDEVERRLKRGGEEAERVWSETLETTSGGNSHG